MNEYYYGNKISDYGMKHNRVDYGCLAKAFDAELNNNIMQETYDLGYWSQESGIPDYSDEIDDLSVQIEELEYESADLSDRLEELEDQYYELPEPDTDEHTAKEYENIEAKMNLVQDQIDDVERKIDDLQDQIDEYERLQDEPDEVFQWYIVSDSGARILEEINEIIYYNDVLDMYLWGVTHYGTSWDYVLTDIKIDDDKD